MRPGRSSFELAVTPHLHAGYQLARWLTKSDHDAQDVVQEAWLRAHRFFDGFAGGNVRAWFLSVVRNACWTWLERNRPTTLASGPAALEAAERDPGQQRCGPATPEAELLRKADARALTAAIGALPPEFREAFVLRELEGLSYKEIAAACGIPIGTVMSRLSRAREALRLRLAPAKEGTP